MARITEDLRYFIVENTSYSARQKGGHKYDVVPMRSIEAYNGRPILAEDLELSAAFDRVKELEAEKKAGELF